VVLKNKTTRQDRQCLPVYFLRVDRHNRHTEEIPDGPEKTVLIHFAGIEHLADPRTTVQILRELHCFVARSHASGEQNIYDRLAGRRAHRLFGGRSSCDAGMRNGLAEPVLSLPKEARPSILAIAFARNLICLCPAEDQAAAIPFRPLRSRFLLPEYPGQNASSFRSSPATYIDRVESALPQDALK
jgi:hypothetical protein